MALYLLKSMKAFCSFQVARDVVVDGIVFRYTLPIEHPAHCYNSSINITPSRLAVSSPTATPAAWSISFSIYLFEWITTYNRCFACCQGWGGRRCSNLQGGAKGVGLSNAILDIFIRIPCFVTKASKSLSVMTFNETKFSSSPGI